jgi:iron complex outermembrane receptor protein
MNTQINAAKARIWGIEADLDVRFNQVLSAKLGLAYNNAKFTQFGPPRSAQQDIPNFYTGISGPAGNSVVPLDASGYTMPRAPKFTASFSPRATFDALGGEINATANLYYASQSYLTIDHLIVQPEYATVDATVSWSPKGTGLTLSAYGRNLTNKAVLGGAFITALANTVTWKPPRTYGIAAEYRF